MTDYRICVNRYGKYKYQGRYKVERGLSFWECVFFPYTFYKYFKHREEFLEYKWINEDYPSVYDTERDVVKAIEEHKKEQREYEQDRNMDWVIYDKC